MYSLSIVFALLGTIFLCASIWVDRKFGVITIEQILVHLQGGVEGVTTGDSSLVVSFVRWVLIFPTVSVAVAIVGFLVLKRLLRSRSSEPTRRWRPSLRSVAFTLSTVLILGSGTLLANQVSFIDTVRAQLSGESLSTVYAAPVVNQTPEQKTNLVMIYLESMETTYGFEDVFGQDLLEPLEASTAGWEQIDTLRQGPGLGWTMAGVVGTQCGIPLKSEILAGESNADANEIGATSEQFLPGATCLGDVLQDAGYTNHFMGGADGTFASKKTFMTEHGYTEFLDRTTWAEAGETEMNGWGLQDSRLFDLAADKVSELREQEAPYNLTLISLDSHSPGLVGNECKETQGTEMDKAIKCSLQAVSTFIDALDEMGALEDTAVVLMGDHLAMVSNSDMFQGQPENGRERTIYNRIWSPNDVAIERNETDQYSMYPTVLELLGFDLQSGRAGLGLSSIGDYPIDDTMYALDDRTRTSRVLAPSKDLYAQLWHSAG